MLIHGQNHSLKSSSSLASVKCVFPVFQMSWCVCIFIIQPFHHSIKSWTLKDYTLFVSVVVSVYIFIYIFLKSGRLQLAVLLQKEYNYMWYINAGLCEVKVLWRMCFESPQLFHIQYQEVCFCRCGLKRFPSTEGLSLYSTVCMGQIIRSFIFHSGI